MKWEDDDLEERYRYLLGVREITEVARAVLVAADGHKGVLRKQFPAVRDLDELLQEMKLAVMTYPPESVPEHMTGYLIQVAKSILAKRAYIEKHICFDSDVADDAAEELGEEVYTEVAIRTPDIAISVEQQDALKVMFARVYGMKGTKKFMRALELHILGASGESIAHELRVDTKTAADYISRCKGLLKRAYAQIVSEANGAGSAGRRDPASPVGVLD